MLNLTEWVLSNITNSRLRKENRHEEETKKNNVWRTKRTQQKQKGKQGSQRNQLSTNWRLEIRARAPHLVSCVTVLRNPISTNHCGYIKKRCQSISNIIRRNAVKKCERPGHARKATINLIWAEYQRPKIVIGAIGIYTRASSPPPLLRNIFTGENKMRNSRTKRERKIPSWDTESATKKGENTYQQRGYHNAGTTSQPLYRKSWPKESRAFGVQEP